MFALSSSAPLYHRPPRPLPTHQLNQTSLHHRLVEEKHMYGIHPHPEFNSLKFACRQLHAETAGLELQHNALFFKSHSTRPPNHNPFVKSMHHKLPKSAESWFFDFVTPMAPHKLAWLNTVIIASDHAALSMHNAQSPPMQNLSMLAFFCKQHPRITMRYQFLNFCFDHADTQPSLQLLSVGTALIVALRGNDAGVAAAKALMPDNVWTRVMVMAAQVWRDSWGVDHVLRGIENFSFWPKTEMWRDEILVDLVLGDAEELGAGEEKGKVWVEHMLGWRANGIMARK